MRKILAFILTIVITFNLTACSFDSLLKKDSTNSNVQTVTVPNLIGLSSEDAQKLLNSNNLSFTIIETASTSVAKGFVISQSPVAQTTVEPLSFVTIYVSGTETNEVSLYCRASISATLRDVPSRSGAKLADIACGEKVTYINSSGEFYYVQYKNAYGYVLVDFFSTDKNAPINYGTGSAPLVVNDYLYCRASQYVNLRSYPSTSAPSLAQIYCRERVTYLGTAGDFYYVSYRGAEGYVLKDFFSKDSNAPINYKKN
ncbi:MAG: PASTA domain-containing protein [Ruminococcaceae bacterium]|nr:PASTA domain-containing protein [Oscillospiraceae bacterium]